MSPLVLWGRERKSQPSGPESPGGTQWPALGEHSGCTAPQACSDGQWVAGGGGSGGGKNLKTKGSDFKKKSCDWEDVR